MCRCATHTHSPSGVQVMYHNGKCKASARCEHTRVQALHYEQQLVLGAELGSFPPLPLVPSFLPWFGAAAQFGSIPSVGFPWGYLCPPPAWCCPRASPIPITTVSCGLEGVPGAGCWECGRPRPCLRAPAASSPLLARPGESQRVHSGLMCPGCMHTHKAVRVQDMCRGPRRPGPHAPICFPNQPKTPGLSHPHLLPPPPIYLPLTLCVPPSTLLCSV